MTGFSDELRALRDERESHMTEKDLYFDLELNRALKTWLDAIGVDVTDPETCDILLKFGWTLMKAADESADQWNHPSWEFLATYLATFTAYLAKGYQHDNAQNDRQG